MSFGGGFVFRSGRKRRPSRADGHGRPGTVRDETATGRGREQFVRGGHQTGECTCAPVVVVSPLVCFFCFCSETRQLRGQQGTVGLDTDGQNQPARSTELSDQTESVRRGRRHVARRRVRIGHFRRHIVVNARRGALIRKFIENDSFQRRRRRTDQRTSGPHDAHETDVVQRRRCTRGRRRPRQSVPRRRLSEIMIRRRRRRNAPPVINIIKRINRRFEAHFFRRSILLFAARSTILFRLFSTLYCSCIYTRVYEFVRYVVRG